MSTRPELVFVAAQRTPFGAFGGSFAGQTAVDLGTHAAVATLKAGKISPEDIDATVFGNVIQSCPDAAYMARHVGLRAGVPIDRPALTVNRLCGSGFEAIVQGAYLILNGEARTVLVGGSENMSETPFVLRGARWGYRMGNGELEDLLSSGLTDSYVNLPMAITAENLAVQYGFSRIDVDTFALQSQKRAAAAWAENIFKNEISPVTLQGRKGETIVAKDEHFRLDSSMEGLAKLKPVFKKDGVVTAGNASGITDGAAALILTTAEVAKAKGWTVLGKLKSWASRGCDPKIMGIGPVPATHAAMATFEKNFGKKISIADFKRVEVNEAFAAQFLAVEKELKLNRDKTNIHGGAIALGHPLAASGARLVAHLLHTLPAQGGGLGLASACIGGGQGMSVIVEV